LSREDDPDWQLRILEVYLEFRARWIDRAISVFLVGIGAFTGATVASSYSGSNTTAIVLLIPLCTLSAALWILVRSESKSELARKLKDAMPRLARGEAIPTTEYQDLVRRLQESI
jgi:amino acid transporter